MSDSEKKTVLYFLWVLYKLSLSQPTSIMVGTTYARRIPTNMVIIQYTKQAQFLIALKYINPHSWRNSVPQKLDCLYHRAPGNIWALKPTTFLQEKLGSRTVSTDLRWRSEESRSLTEVTSVGIAGDFLYEMISYFTLKIIANWRERMKVFSAVIHMSIECTTKQL